MKQALDNLAKKSTENLISGFRAAGIHPINRTQILKKLPDYKPQDASVPFSDVLVSTFQEARMPEQKSAKKKSNQLDIQPGQSVTSEEALEMIEKKQADRKMKMKPKKIKVYFIGDDFQVLIFLFSSLSGSKSIERQKIVVK